MDLQKFAEGFSATTAVISVEKKPQEGYGRICIAAGNQRFIDLVEGRLISGTTGAAHSRFIPGSDYDKYLARDPGFEDICFRAALQKKTMYTYIYLNRVGMWFNVIVMPLEQEDEGVCYCTYTMEPCDLTDMDFSSMQSLKTSSDVLRTCIKLHDTNDFRQTMVEIIKDIRHICNAEVCTIMLTDSGTGTCSVLATDIADDSRIKRVTQFSNFYDIAVSWIKMIGEKDCLIIKNDKDMQYVSMINYPWYLTLAEANVQSVVMFPLRYNNEILGFIWATNFDTRETMRIKETLELTTFFISSEIASYRLMERLEHISYSDLLTGVSNRNAMNNRISGIIAGEEKLAVPYGVVFADLNGLKGLNDSRGHSAGDLLLKKSALLLQESFPGSEIYRAGGDEFMVIVQGCGRDSFMGLVAALKEQTGSPEGVSFAVGSYYTEEDCDIRKAMHIADEDMYKNKEEYYERYPERRNR